MKSTKYIVVAALAAVLASGSAIAADGKERSKQGKEACAHTMCDRHGHGGFGALMGAYHVDNLTESQLAQLNALREQQRKQMEEGMADRAALQEALDQGADEATLRPLAEKEGRHVTEMIMQQASMRTQVEAILTPEQSAQLKEMGKMGMGKGMGMGGKSDHCDHRKPKNEQR